MAEIIPLHLIRIMPAKGKANKSFFVSTTAKVLLVYLLSWVRILPTNTIENDPQSKAVHMEILINNTVKEVKEQSTLYDALSQLGFATTKGIAIAVNNNVIPRSSWESMQLSTGMHITIIKATQGG